MNGAELCVELMSGWWDEQAVGTMGKELAERGRLAGVRWVGRIG